jgi:hypothetical protein
MEKVSEQKSVADEMKVSASRLAVADGKVRACLAGCLADKLSMDFDEGGGCACPA